MPVARYFFFVGGVLLALMFAINAAMPKLPAVDQREAGVDLTTVRIHSDRKWPAPVVFDTTIPTIVPAQLAKANAAVAAPAVVADVPPKTRSAFAQLEPASPKRQEPKPRPKHRVARNRVVAPLVMMAQQPRFGSPFNNFW